MTNKKIVWVAVAAILLISWKRSKSRGSILIEPYEQTPGSKTITGRKGKTIYSINLDVLHVLENDQNFELINELDDRYIIKWFLQPGNYVAAYIFK